MQRIWELCLVFFLLLAGVSKIEAAKSPYLFEGIESEPGQFPFVAHLTYIRPSGETQPGTGIMISDRFLLARASALAFWGNLTVTLGAVFATRSEPEQQTFFVNADDFIYLEDYDIDSDLAIVPLPRPAQLNPRVQPVNLPRYSDKGLVYTGWNAIWNGWKWFGEGELRAAHVPTVISSPDKCNKLASDGILCINIGKQIASGLDPGAPVVINGPDGYTLVGMFSYTSGLTEILIRINEHLDFIANNTNVIIKP